MQDLGAPLGGAYSAANWINDVGQVVGAATLPRNQAFHAVLWEQGRATDLGVVSGAVSSVAESINLFGQVVGDLDDSSGEDVGGFLWQNGVMYDLTTLIPPGSGLTIAQVWQINDQGEIAGDVMLANGDFHAFLMVPCDQHDPGNCQNQLFAAGENTNQSPRSQHESSRGRDPLARFHAPSLPR
jgi:probable HAF family extracellular repeat protein